MAKVTMDLIGEDRFPLTAKDYKPIELEASNEDPFLEASWTRDSLETTETWVVTGLQITLKNTTYKRVRIEFFDFPFHVQSKKVSFLPGDTLRVKYEYKKSIYESLAA